MKKILNMPFKASVTPKVAEDISNKIHNLLEAEEINQDDKIVILTSTLLGVIEIKVQTYYGDRKHIYNRTLAFAVGLINTFIDELNVSRLNLLKKLHWTQLL